jgi:hypothetical protein
MMAAVTSQNISWRVWWINDYTIFTDLLLTKSINQHSLNKYVMLPKRVCNILQLALFCIFLQIYYYYYYYCGCCCYCCCCYSHCNIHQFCVMISYQYHWCTFLGLSEPPLTPTVHFSQENYNKLNHTTHKC